MHEHLSSLTRIAATLLRSRQRQSQKYNAFLCVICFDPCRDQNKLQRNDLLIYKIWTYANA
jgi:hypothetical protein